MSHRIGRVRAAAALAGTLLAAALAPALGHAPGAAIQLSHDVIRPGETISVSGQSMNPDETITFELGDATKALTLGTAVATGDGFVQAVLLIPWQTPKGTWTVYARGIDGDVVTAPVTLAGVPINPDDEEGEPPDEEDPFTDPTPTPTPTPGSSGVSPSPEGTAVAAAPELTFRPRTLPPQPIEAPVAAPPARAATDPGLSVVIVASGLVLAVLLVVAVGLRRRPATPSS
jgi:hypothetical protein